ncbi:cation diffusion facilitator family transporter [Terrabacter carboxydivorans]|uniref:Cation diffusion facilitator family transporter n=1 Tax=Terrabacter carboxydivorans TaxID=619730 RepID=A0ABP5Z9R8_9MICO
MWGLLSGTRVILFDGVSAGIGLVMSVFALRAAQAAERGESDRFPYGRQSVLPLTIGLQGVARLGFTAYAVTDAVLVIAVGGDDVSTGSATLYAVVATALCLLTWLWLRRRAGASELVAAEVVGWRIASLLSAAILCGFLLVTALPAGDVKDTASALVDPVLVIVVSLLVLPAPVGFVRTMLRELLEMTPPPHIEEPARKAVTEVCAAMDLPDPVIRMLKTGGRLYVEVDHVVSPGQWDVADIDRLRQALAERLRSTAVTAWINVELSCDPAWQQG